MSVKIDLNHKIHVLTKKEELDKVRLSGKIVVVLDILFATSTMVTALAHGATEVIPVLDESAARAESGRYRDCVVAGELDADTIPGFAHPAPLALLKHGIEGKTLIYSTTNGTVAMTQAAGAARVYCGALLNARRLAEHIVARHPRETVLLVCSGSGDNFNFEDFYGAGYFVERFADLLGAAADLSDSSRAGCAWSVVALEPEAADEEPGEPVDKPDPGAPPGRLTMPLPRRHPLGARAHSLLQAVVQLLGEAGVVDEYVRLAREQQAERVDVGGADAGGAPIEDRHLGVQEALVVLVDLDAGVEQPAVEAAHGVVQEEILHAALEQEAHPDAALGCRVQRTAKCASGQEVGAGDDDLQARRLDVPQVGVLDVAAMPQAVAHHQARMLRAAGRRRRQSGIRARPAAQGGPGHQQPEPGGRVAHLAGERSLDAHRVVVARRLPLAALEIVDHVDAADERHLAVDGGELAMHPAQPAAPPAAPPEFGPEHEQVRARSAQAFAKPAGGVGGGGGAGRQRGTPPARPRERPRA